MQSLGAIIALFCLGGAPGGYADAAGAAAGLSEYMTFSTCFVILGGLLFVVNIVIVRRLALKEEELMLVRQGMGGTGGEIE